MPSARTWARVSQWPPSIPGARLSSQACPHREIDQDWKKKKKKKPLPIMVIVATLALNEKDMSQRTPLQCEFQWLSLSKKWRKLTLTATKMEWRSLWHWKRSKAAAIVDSNRRDGCIQLRYLQVLRLVWASLIFFPRTISWWGRKPGARFRQP